MCEAGRTVKPFRAVLCIVLAAVLTQVSSIRGQASQFGEWSAVFDMPLVTVHAALMRTGQLLFFDAWEIPGTPSARLWNPATNAYTPVPNGFAELFCAGHFLTNDGRLITSGGHNGGGVGTTDATAFDPTTLQWTALANLNYARWYPSIVQLADGRALTLGGAISRPENAEVPEALAPGATAWTTFPGAQRDVGEYPDVYQASDGRVFVTGGTPGLLDLSASSWAPLGSGPASSGASVMYRPGKIMKASGATNGADPVITATGVIDLDANPPAWRQTPSLAYARSQHNLVILPDGKVLVVGGAAEVSLVSTQPVLAAEIWDPNTETWTVVASMARPRMYHSIAILLPDGRVLAAGGGRLGPNEQNGEFYSPPYLFRGARPAITGAPASVGYGATFSVTTPDAANISRVTLVRASSVTHGLNLDQRFVELPFTAGSGTLSVQAPGNSRTAPAGDYLLFVLNAQDVPSLARFVRLDAVGGVTTLSVSDASVNEGTASGNSLVFTVSLNGTSSQTVTVNYSTVAGTAEAGVDYSTRTGTLSFPPGTATRTVSVPTLSDSLVEPNESLTLQLSAPANATIGDGSGVGTIVNDDVPSVPTLAIDSVSVVEGSSGTPVAAFTVTLSGASALSVLVSYRTQPGTATSPADFTSTTGTLTFAGGTTRQTIQVPIVADAAVEPPETFTVELDSPVNAVIETSVGTATITDDDSGTVTATYVVAGGADDVNEDGTTFTPAGSQVWLGSGANATASYLGLRFTGVSIPAGAAVTAAHLEVTPATTQWNAFAFETAAEASTNGAPFSSAARPSQRALLAPRVQHQSDVQWTANARVSLEDIAPLVQAAVQQPGWAGQALTLVLRGTGGAWARKVVQAAEAGSAVAPRLVVTYAVGGAPLNQLPVIGAATASPLTGVAPLAVNFSGAATDPEGAPLTYAWSFGDSTTGTGPAVAHTYTAAGTYTARLTVSDGTDAVQSAPLTISVGTAVLPSLTVSDVSVTEGQSATTAATFSVTLSAAGAATVSVAYATANGTAAAPGDYASATGTLSFAPGVTTRTIAVQVVGDTAVESAETFAVNLSAPTNATIADGSATGTIVDDDSAGGGTPVTVTYAIGAGGDDVNEEGTTFAPGSTGVWIGNASSATASYLGLRFTGVTIPAGATISDAHLELTASTTQWNAVAFELAAEAAVNSAAFSTTARPSQRTLLAPRVQHSSNVQWTSGTRYSLENIATLVQAVIDQAGWASGQALSVIARGTSGAWARKFVASAESSAASKPRLVVTYTVGAGDPVNQPPVIASAAAAPTGGAAPLAVSFTGAATDPEGAPLTYTWSFGDATSGTGASVSHTYTGAGTYTATLTVSDGALSATSAPLTITTSAPLLPLLSLSDTSVTEGQSGTASATLTVTLSSASLVSVQVNYATANGTAAAPGDYTATSGTVTFTAGATSQTIAVQVAGDTTVEADETFTVTLSGAVGATIADGTGIGTIVNDDSAAGGTPLTVTYTLSGGTNDVNQEGNTFTPGSNGVWIGNGSSATASYFGLRFTGVTIPAGAIVSEAHLEVTASGTQWNAMAFELAAEAAVNSAAFSASSTPSQRTLLTPRVQHSSNVQWTSGTRYSLESITALVQAVIDQPGWASGQALSVIVRGTAGAWARKFIGSAESGGTVAPRLVVTYTVP